MNINIVSNNNNEEEFKPQKFVSIRDANIVKNIKGNIIPSKTLIINELNVSIKQDFDGDIDFRIETKPGVLSDNRTIPKLDITAKEDISFDSDLTLPKLKSIIRRCGILDDYKEYFDNDPEIIINQYTLNIQKKYKYFDEFNEGIMIAGEIVT